MQKKFFKQFQYTGTSIFISDNGVLTLFYFLKTMCVLVKQESDFHRHSMPLSVMTNRLKIIT